MVSSRPLIGFSLLALVLAAVHFQAEGQLLLLVLTSAAFDLLYAACRSPTRYLLRCPLILAAATLSFFGLGSLGQLYFLAPVLIRTMITIIQLGDVLQYYFGMYFGRHHVNPFSPKKTLEGYLLAAATLPGVLGLLRAVSLPLLELSSLEVLGLYFLSVLSGVCYSLLKRLLQLKDWSPLLGSHGGFLDRADSLILPSLYLYFH